MKSFSVTMAETEAAQAPFTIADFQAPASEGRSAGLLILADMSPRPLSRLVFRKDCFRVADNARGDCFEVIPICDGE